MTDGILVTNFGGSNKEYFFGFQIISTDYIPSNVDHNGPFGVCCGENILKKNY